MQKNFYPKGKHHKYCYSVENVNNDTWNSAWVLEGYVFATKFGNTKIKSGKTMFIKFRCNCTYCDAILLVNQDFVLDILPRL